MMSHLLLLWDCKIHIFLLFMVFYNRHAEKLFTSLPFTSCTINFCSPEDFFETFAKILDIFEI